MKLKNILKSVLKEILPSPLSEVDKITKAIELHPESKYIFLFDRNQISWPKIDRAYSRLPKGSLVFSVYNVNCAIRAYEIVKDEE